MQEAPVAAPRGTMGLTFARVDPVEHGEAIKQFFLAHERPEFPGFFDRAYRGPAGEGGGATSWVGWDEHGTLRAHIALFPRRFLFERRVVRGALLANMLVATGYRTFWPGLALVRQMVKDTKDSGSVDFLYADPNEPARALAQATGFRYVGPMQRFVLPLRDPRHAVDLGIQAYNLFRRLRAGRPSLVVAETRAVAAPDPPPLPTPTGAAGVLRPIRGLSLYHGRLAGYPGSSDWWFTFHTPGSPALPLGRALVRWPDERGVAVLCALECEPVTLLGALLVALGRRLRRAGAARLELSVMAHSQGAAAARRAGFVARDDRIPILARSFTEIGAAVVAAGAEWRLLPVDLDRGA